MAALRQKFQEKEAAKERKYAERETRAAEKAQRKQEKKERSRAGSKAGSEKSSVLGYGYQQSYNQSREAFPSYPSAHGTPAPLLGAGGGGYGGGGAYVMGSGDSSRGAYKGEAGPPTLHASPRRTTGGERGGTGESAGKKAKGSWAMFWMRVRTFLLNVRRKMGGKSGGEKGASSG